MSTKKNKFIKKNNEISAPEIKSLNVYIGALICFLFAFLLYSNTFNHSFVLDDYGALADNWIVKKGFDGIPIILQSSYRYGVDLMTDNLYRPLSQIMFAIEWQISPDNPSFYHIVNVFFYALSCFLLYIVLRKFLNNTHPIISLLIVFLYIAHPIHTEVVANIKSRDEIMSFFFLMLSLLFLHKWFTKSNIWGLIIAMLMFFLSFLSKEGVITMLFLFPFFGWYFTKTTRKNLLIASLLLIIPAVLYIVIRHLILSQYDEPSSVSVIDNFLVGAPDFASHFATATMLLGKYFLLLLIPYQLVSDYSFNQLPIIGLGDLRFILSFLIYVSMFIYVVFNIRKKNMIVFGILFYLITISIYSNIFITVGSSFGERFMFLPSLGICIAFVFIISKYLNVDFNLKQSELEILKSKPIYTLVFVLILLFFSIKTIVRASEWKNQYKLFGKDVLRSPNSAHMHVYWGLALRDNAMKQDDMEKKKSIMLKAINEFEKSLVIYPSYVDCYEQLGLAWFRLNDNEKALSYYEKALKYAPENSVTWNNIGIIYFDKGNYTKAMEVYKKAIELFPNYADAYFNMGSVLGMMGRFEEAIIEFKKCIKYDPDNRNAHYYMGITYQNMKNEKEAQIWIEKASILDMKNEKKKAKNEK